MLIITVIHGQPASLQPPNLSRTKPPNKHAHVQNGNSEEEKSRVEFRDLTKILHGKWHWPTLIEKYQEKSNEHGPLETMQCQSKRPMLNHFGCMKKIKINK